MKKHLLLVSILFYLAGAYLYGQDRIIKIDFDKSSGPLNTMFRECIGAGRANEGLRADWQQAESVDETTG